MTASAQYPATTNSSQHHTVPAEYGYHGHPPPPYVQRGQYENIRTYGHDGSNNLYTSNAGPTYSLPVPQQHVGYAANITPTTTFPQRHWHSFATDRQVAFGGQIDQRSLDQQPIAYTSVAAHSSDQSQYYTRTPSSALVPYWNGRLLPAPQDLRRASAVNISSGYPGETPMSATSSTSSVPWNTSETATSPNSTVLNEDDCSRRSGDAEVVRPYHRISSRYEVAHQVHPSHENERHISQGLTEGIQETEPTPIHSFERPSSREDQSSDGSESEVNYGYSTSSYNTKPVTEASHTSCLLSDGHEYARVPPSGPAASDYEAHDQRQLPNGLPQSAQRLAMSPSGSSQF